MDSVASATQGARKARLWWAITCFGRRLRRARARKAPSRRCWSGRNLFYRQDEIRTKSFAANLDQILILIAAEPVFSESQLARALIAAEAAGIQPLIALNKSDLVEPFARAWERLLPYRRMGGGHHYGVLPLSLSLSAEVDRTLLMQHLQGKTTLVLGPSGSGKSTLINLLVPGASVLTGEISQAPQLRQAHHDQYNLVLGGCSPHHCADRFAGLSGVWPTAHRTHAAGLVHARHRGPRHGLQVLQLHSPA